MIDVLEAIPEGFNNAITRGDLGLLLGAPDRDIRAAIQAARENGHPIINVGTGYFIPTNDDTEYVRQYMHSTRSRYRALVKTMKQLDKYLDSVGQISLEGME